jgi:hypothetical protein
MSKFGVLVLGPAGAGKVSFEDSISETQGGFTDEDT